MEVLNEPTFELCPHDKENPYKQISRALIQDRSISPKAKGVLIYLLSLPKDWKIHHSQLQYGLNIGEDYLNSALDELIKAGYADRTRERIKGIFQPYRYKIREFKKSSPNRETPNGALSDTPNRENRPGSSGPENPALQIKETTSTKETTTNDREPVAAVFSEKDQEKEHPKVYPILESVDIPIHDKEEITRDYSEADVVHGLTYALQPGRVIKTCLAATIKWACKIRPELTQSKEDIEQANKLYAQRYDMKKSGSCEVVVCNKYVEIVTSVSSNSYVFGYHEAKFMENFKGALKKCQFTILD